MSAIALIPAYNPESSLVAYVQALIATHFKQVIVVNDGSAQQHRSVFNEIKLIPNVIVLEHAVNVGKGAALKTGLNYIACHYPDAVGAVTIDADGQHLLQDAIAVAKTLEAHSKQLILGTRSFDKNVPLRSKVGNVLTRYLFKLLIGCKITDTQSGLRGIPMCLVKNLLLITANGYEFELDMLVLAHRNGYSIIQQPISTVYIDGNRSSHFRPLRDSLRIYFVLFRFTIIALMSALLDYGIFIALFYLLVNDVMACLIAGRLISTIFNYINVKRYAFNFRGYHQDALPKYIVLACTSTIMAYILINGFMTMLGMHVIIAKLLSELIMFVMNFLIQRDFIFRKPVTY